MRRPTGLEGTRMGELYEEIKVLEKAFQINEDHIRCLIGQTRLLQARLEMQRRGLHGLRRKLVGPEPETGPPVNIVSPIAGPNGKTSR